VIPDLDKEGKLPPGVHVGTWEELTAMFGTTAHRAALIDGLYRAAMALKDAGCKTLYIDGSFVTTKETPSDFDGCWDPSGVDSRKLDSVLLDFDNLRLNQKLKYGGELFPSTARAEAAAPHRTFLEFFQNDKDTGRPKGIIAIDLGGLP
jgi:hypothetical protein